MKETTFNAREYVDRLMERVQQHVIPLAQQRDYEKAENNLIAILTDIHFEERESLIECSLHSGLGFNASIALLLNSLEKKEFRPFYWNALKMYHAQTKLPHDESV